jgi:hypothetical protein
MGVNQYYQDSDWTISARFGVVKGGREWWHPSLVLGAHDIGRPEDTAISLTGFKDVEVPYLEELWVHAGVFTETDGDGETRGFGGLTKQFTKTFDLSLLFDGEEPHAILGTTYKGLRVFVMAYEMEHLGGGLSFMFDCSNLAKRLSGFRMND